MRSVCRFLVVWTIAGLSLVGAQAASPDEPEPLARPIPTSVEHRVLFATDPHRGQIITQTDDLGEEEVQVTDGNAAQATRALHSKPVPTAQSRSAGQRTTHLRAKTMPRVSPADCTTAVPHPDRCVSGNAGSSALGCGRCGGGDGCTTCGDSGACCGFDCLGCGRVNCLGCLRGWLGNGLRGDHWYNCQCSGSYKFPVPPQYTYHWPGLYSHRLMTDYHSPWRFPPLRPFTDEPSAETLAPTAHRAPPSAARLHRAVTAVPAAVPLTDYTLSPSMLAKPRLAAVEAASFDAPLARSAEEAARPADASSPAASAGREAEPVSRKLERWYGNR